ncbi:proton myo-inositol cotransporter-like [Gigantopelta aegis]|uniref:proton myo-inositol cotransporter-like n=1 Tax=Gigantopelta aegis TaxID=1735272 RepID=UPI001B88CCE2|nr:proton myo-inositol cotransporter-like [Gigantopelta aegis]
MFSSDSDYEEELELASYSAKDSSEKAMLSNGNNDERRHIVASLSGSENVSDDAGSVSEEPGSSHLNVVHTPKFVWILAFFSAIGGFLFGYDTGVVSGALILLKDRFGLTTTQEELFVSVTIGTACVGAFSGGFINDHFGRKFSTILASVIFTIGALVLGVAQNFAMLIAGRLILGLGIGLASMTVPVYIAECAPPHLRGRMVTLNTLFITGGQTIASFMDGAFSYIKPDGWRYMLGLAAIPSVIQMTGFMFLPESPRWLMKKNREAKARSVLVTIRGTPNVDGEMQIMHTVCEEERRLKEQNSGFVLLRMLRTPYTRRALTVGCGLQLFQQLSGINTVMYYSASIIKMAGVSDQHLAIWLAAVTATINFLFTIVGVWLVEKLGRRRLLLGSLSGVVVSLIFLAVSFQLAAFHSPPITVHEAEGSNSSCNNFIWCENCIERSNCGYCFIKDGSGAANGSCLAMTSKDTTHSLYGRCNSTSLSNGLVWADNYCPTSYSWMAIMGLVVYLMFFAPGMGPMPWTINSEIYPLWARSTGNSVTAATNWISNLLVSMSFLTLSETLTKYGTYWLFTGIALIALVFFSFFLPETKGKRLEEVEELFSKPWCQCKKDNDYLSLDSTN